LVPKPPYHIQATDVLTIQIEGGLPGEAPPPENRYLVDAAGRIDLGPQYNTPENKANSKVKVAGLTEDEATAKIEAALRNVVKAPQVSVQLFQSAAMQPISGEHIVGPDGTVNMGSYGTVYVAGMTLDEAKAAVEAKLAEKLENPQAAVSVFAYNSKVYYV